MLAKISNTIKKSPLSELVCMLLFIVLFIVFTSLFSFHILQADDFSYATYWREGIFEFFKKTLTHFQTFNGRVLVHLVAQSVLALPGFFVTLINSAVVLLTGFLSLKCTGYKKSPFLYLSLFYTLLLLSGREIFKDAIMWISAFYNYVFPACLILLSLFLLMKKNKWSYLACFLAGATTEQWGFAGIIMLSALVFSQRKFKFNLKDWTNVFSALCGYGTIFLSPATRERITYTGHGTVSGSLIDIPRLSEIFLKGSSGITVIIIFIILTIAAAVFLKGNFSLLYSGILPLALMLTIPIHKSYTGTFIIFVCYLILCFGLFWHENNTTTAIFIGGAIGAIIIMLPTNTFESRITFPGIILLIAASLSLFFSLDFSLNISVPSACVFSVAVLVFFHPTYSGFMNNYRIERSNLNAIKEAYVTKELCYNIDYNKDFAVKQMFNDGWFYKEFISLYHLEDCTVSIASKNCVPLSGTNIQGLIYKGDIYIPVRTFAEEKNGTITTEGDTVISINNKTLTLSDSAFIYKNKEGKKKYSSADRNRINNFYALYIKLDLINEAFDLNIKEGVA